MTRAEFLEKAKKKYEVFILKYNGSYHDFILKMLNKENCAVKDISKIGNFLDEFSLVRLIADGTVKNDKISKNICLRGSGSYWEDIKVGVVKVAWIRNTSKKAISFYMSETGKFYTENHEKIANNTDEFLKYFLDVPCNYHEPPSKYTYQMLREAGWYEGRRIDISQLIIDCEKDGVFLTDKQKEFISEFGNINVGEVSIEIDKDNGCYEPNYFSGHFSADTISVGYYKTVSRIYLSIDGRLYDDIGEPFGLDAMEAFHIMLNNL